MAESDANIAQYSFRAAKLSPREMLVVSFNGSEAISRLYHYRILVASKNRDLKSEDLVGKVGVLTILMNPEDGNGTPDDPDVARFVNGIICRFDHLFDGTTFSHYELELVPFVWLLRLRKSSRIFQQMTAPDIIKKVLTDAGLTSEMFQFALQSTYLPREYCVQYRETDWDFIQRLAEEEGIFYFFEHKEETHLLKFGDTPEVHLPIDGTPEMPYRPTSGMVETEHISKFRLGQNIKTGMVTGRDFEYTKPVPAIEDVAKATLNPELEVYDYPFQYNSADKKEQTATTRFAKIRLQEYQSTRIFARGEGVCRRLIAGRRFDLTDHPRTETNQTYLVTSMEITGNQPESVQEDHAGQDVVEGPNLLNEITCIPMSVPYRPPRITARPFVQGDQTAIVTGPASEEIYTDKYGRIKVRFHWDREGMFDEKSSMWVRVNQGWAGGGYGHLFIPRIGHEVIVSFMEGNPDEPIVVGSVYNGDQMPPGTLPDQKTRSYVFKSNSTVGGGGTNVIAIDDKKGEEVLYQQAEKDMEIYIKNDELILVKANLYETVGKESREKIGGNHSRAVGGAEAISVGGDRSITVSKGDVLEKYSVNQKKEVTADYLCKAGANILIEAGTQLTIKGPGGFLTIDASGVTIVGTLVKINSGGAAGVVAPGSPASPAEPEEPPESKPGKDVDYTGKKEPPQPVPVPELPKKSWIDISMKDTEGVPKAGEPYVVIPSDGENIEGTLDVNGEARIRGVEPGTCKIIFPNRDTTEVQKA